MIARALLVFVLAAAGARASDLVVETLAPLPQALSNNAVALQVTAGEPVLFSFMGLGGGRQPADITAGSWRFGDGAWRPLSDLPVEGGRLAGIAATVAGDVWLFGGYTVAADGAEVSTPEVYRWREAEGAWLRAPDMPVPVDDTTAFVYRDRFIYLVSGWHDRGNVNLVQVLDTQELEWHQATPYPGDPVFGHAGGMAGRRMVACGGVRIEYPAQGGPRRFLPSAQCWLGEVDAEDYRRIAWRPLEPHPGAPRYRAAATGDGLGRVVFAGGSANPYNFDGIGYDGFPSEPEPAVISLDLDTLAWSNHGDLPQPSMDHRGLLQAGGWYFLVGGMLAGQRVTDRVVRFRLED